MTAAGARNALDLIFSGAGGRTVLTRRRYRWPDRATIRASYRTKGSFSTWQPGFLEGYISCGTETTDSGEVKLCCEPDWESRCFAVCPHDVWRHIPKLRVPTLVLYGTRSDTFLRPAVNRFAREVPDATLVGFQETGHFVPMERPDECAAAIFDFLEKKGIL